MGASCVDQGIPVTMCVSLPALINKLHAWSMSWKQKLGMQVWPHCGPWFSAAQQAAHSWKLRSCETALVLYAPVTATQTCAFIITYVSDDNVMQAQVYPSVCSWCPSVFMKSQCLVMPAASFDTLIHLQRWALMGKGCWSCWTTPMTSCSGSDITQRA